ncbi:SDR family oxidoreductase [Pseudoxanthobacter sp. M-2]|uniref:SDR family NAD(P)-dependent oxidoreductase n=1 Tax=Pseudoxanthobacter sp. M-2 TaxID=3078754 RepID=UPI0038FD2591
MPPARPADPFDVSGRRILITGASSGIGRYAALMLASRGAHVVLAARRRDALEAVAAAAREAGAAGADVVPLDVTDAASVEAAVAAATATAPLDALLNNAGIAATGAALEQSVEGFDGILAVDLRGAFLVAQAVARTWTAGKRGGVVVNVASILGLRVASHVAPYAIAKAGLVQMTKALALEWARHGIRVNALAPGYVETDINADFFATDAGQALVKRVPQRRLLSLSDLDGPLLLLLSDAGRGMTGAVVAVDGGHLVSGL